MLGALLTSDLTRGPCHSGQVDLLGYPGDNRQEQSVKPIALILAWDGPTGERKNSNANQGVL